ncbi:hypothetical protein [Halocynthiibacter namhaensis]|uniref:hypothetical protein n=1 Tax=Halocynthiibacter namhaensis TaxID=1290553 RepID=UPI000AD8A73D|nr:hypothetical protein [Halocynthiibacter namhaensis]
MQPVDLLKLDAQIASITGHKSLEMVKEYSKGTSRKVLEKQAVAKLEQNKKQT